MPTSTTVTIEMPEFESRALAGNPLGDPATRRLPIILPPGYHDPANAGRRYPVLLGLAGFAGKGISMLNDDPWQPNLAQRLDILYTHAHAQIATTGKPTPPMPHAIVVLPDAFTRYGGSQYLNSSATGRYEDYLIDEILPWVDAHYRTIAGPEGRGAFGISSGGYGSLTLGMRHPDVIGAVACISGDMAFDLVYAKDFPAFCNGVNAAGSVEAWWQGFQSRVKKLGSDFDVLNILAMAACYSPDPSQPLGIALPVDLHTCERIPEVWDRWLEWDPVQNVDRYASNLRKLRLLHIEAGTRDEYNLQYGARQLVQRLQERGISHDYHEFDDNHRGLQYRYDVVLPLLAHALASSS